MDALGANPTWPSMSKKVATITNKQDKLRRVISMLLLSEKGAKLAYILFIKNLNETLYCNSCGVLF